MLAVVFVLKVGAELDFSLGLVLKVQSQLRLVILRRSLDKLLLSKIRLRMDRGIPLILLVHVSAGLL